jgi:hypothetical protein
LLVAELDAQPAARGCDGEVSVAEPSHKVKRLAWRLLKGKPQGVLLDVLLDRLAHVRGSSEESVRGHEPVDTSMGSLEIVGIDEQAQPPRAVGEVGKHRAREKLLPQRLPEPLHLAQRLRVLRPALDVADTLAPQLLFELRRASPRGVLPAVVRQHLLGRAVFGDTVQQRLHHQTRLLVVPERVRDDEPRVVIHEGCQVEPLMAS